MIEDKTNNEIPTIPDILTRFNVKGKKKNFYNDLIDYFDEKTL